MMDAEKFYIATKTLTDHSKYITSNPKIYGEVRDKSYQCHKTK